MGDQAACRIDDINLAAFLDFDLRNHVPDELEIDLGDGDALIGARARDGRRSPAPRVLFAILATSNSIATAAPTPWATIHKVSTE